MKIVIGIPAFNEEKNIASILMKLKENYQNIIVCDDGSNDLTAKIAEELGAIVVRHEKNSGYGAAIKTIFFKAHEIGADVLITFDADGQHRIEDIENIIQGIINDEADIVIGSRFLDDKQKMPKYRKVGVKAITKLTNAVSGTDISDSQSGFRAYNKKILQNITPAENGMGVSTEILMKSQKKDFRIKEVPIIIKYEGDTSTHNPVSHGSSVVFSTLQYVAIQRPLTFYGIPGICFLVIGMFFSLWAIQIFTEHGELITNIALVGGGSITIGIILMISASILHSIVRLLKDRN